MLLRRDRAMRSGHRPYEGRQQAGAREPDELDEDGGGATILQSVQELGHEWKKFAERLRLLRAGARMEEARARVTVPQ